MHVSSTGRSRLGWPAFLGVIAAAYVAGRLDVLRKVGDRVIDVLNLEEPLGPRSPGEAGGTP